MRGWEDELILDWSSSFPLPFFIEKAVQWTIELPDDSKEERLELEQITTHGVKNRKEEICSNTKQAKIVLCRSSVIV